MAFLESLNSLRIAIANILNIEFINNSYIYLSFWSVVHFISGFLVALVLYVVLKKKDKITSIITFALLFLYEIVERLAMIYLPQFFLTELGTDTIWDLIVGMLGVGLFLWFKNKKNK